MSDRCASLGRRALNSGPPGGERAGVINTKTGLAQAPSDGPVQGARPVGAAAAVPPDLAFGMQAGAMAPKVSHPAAPPAAIPAAPGPMSEAQIAMAEAARLLRAAADAAEAQASAVQGPETGAAEAAGADLSGLGQIAQVAPQAAGFLKALGHDGRLLILAHLIGGPKSVTELEMLLSARQAVVSQQLARLRHEGLVRARREGQNIIYSINDPKVVAAVGLLGHLFDPTAQQG